ncbi:MAG: FapA family protein [Spirochaetales bacterium]
MGKQLLKAQGTISFAIEDGGLTATAQFVPDGNKEWDDEAFIRAMRGAGIVEGYTRDEALRTIALAAERGTVEPVRIAQGTPPTTPKAETARWTGITVPDDLEQQAERVTSEAKPPEIVLETKQRIKKQKTVVKKSKLPFMPDKTETVDYTEEEIHRKRIYVDPTVERRGYVTEGQKVADIEPTDPGEAGRSVTGDLLPPRLLADPLFYAGPGTERRKGELVAVHDGFLRIGANWADVIAFETHDWEVTLSDDNATCYLSFDPGHAHADPPTAAEIQDRAEELGYPVDRLYEPAKIEEIVARAVRERKPLTNEPLTASRDASFDIFVSDDKLQAVLNLHKATGKGTTLNLKELGAAIKRSRLVELNFDAIKKDISAFFGSTDTELIGYVLAEGTAAEPGPDRGVEYSVRFLPPDRAADVKRELEENGLPPECEAGAGAFPPVLIEDIARVEYDQRVLSIAPAVAGKPGRTVYGEQIAAPEPSEPPIGIFENLAREDNIVVAKRSGLLHRGWKEQTVLLRVVPHEDARIDINLFESKMAASITLVPSLGSGEALPWDRVQQEVATYGIKRGVNEKLLLAAWERMRDGVAVQQLIFARGKHPTEVDDVGIEMLVPLASGKDVTIASDGHADFKNQDRITSVRAGTAIARLRPVASEAQDGWNICGDTIEAGSQSEQDLDAGSHVRIEQQDDGTQVVVAEVDGELIVEGTRFEVRQGHVVDGDVDLHSGNIRFSGSVTVKGSVRTGFFVMSAGDVQIAEMIEAALVSAEGDVIVNQGIKGAGKGVIRTKGSIGLTFAEQATLLAVGNVQARGSLVHCTVKTNGKLRIIGDKGRIIGGRIRCREGVETFDLGSEREVKTIVEFGQDYLVADKIEKEEREIEKLKQEVTKIDLAMKGAERSGKQSLDELHAQKLHYLKLLEKRGLRTFTLRERFEEHHESELVIRGTLWPGVVIETHGRTLEITSPKKNVTMVFNPKSGHIEERSTEDHK